MITVGNNLNWFKIHRMLFLRFRSIIISRQQQYSQNNMKYLDQQEATNIDLELFNDFKFSVDQLMELAGQSCAHAVAKEFQLEDKDDNNILIIAGPGNNGGDALVCGRHLSLMNFKPTIFYPKPTERTLFTNLVHQCSSMGLDFLEDCPTISSVSGYRAIVDGLFGFSFKPPVRENFKEIMNVLLCTDVPIVSIDIPSGWDVDKGNSQDSSEKYIKPFMLISLTAPKNCAKLFKGIHYLGGRFVPKSLETKYKLELPAYLGTETCLKLS